MRRRFAGAHALVTGGSSGIGLAAARLLAAEGAHVSLLARGEERLAAARGAVEAARAEPSQVVRTRAVDVSDRPAVEAAVASLLAEAGPPDLLVTSAGIAAAGPFADLPAEAFERALAVNYLGTLWTVRAALPSMLARGRGHVVLVSSGAGLVGVFGYGAYGPTKFAVRGLAETLRAELKPAGIGVSVVYPPDTDTPQLAEENRTKPAETRAITGNARVLSAETVAAAIVDGVARRRFLVTPGWEMTLLARLHSLLLPLVQWQSDRVVRRVRRGR